MCLKLTPMTWLFWLMLNIYQWRVLHMVITFSAFLCFPKYCWFWSPAWLGHCGVVLHSSCVIQSVLLKTWKTFSPHVCNESWQRTWQNIEKNMTHVFPKPIHAMYSQVHYPNLSRQNMAKQSFWATKVTASGWTIINSQSWRWEYLGEFTLSKLRCSSVASLLFSISSQLFFRSANLRPSWSRWEGLCHFPLVFVCFCWGSSLKPRGLHCSPQSVDWENKALASVALPSHSPWYLMRSSLKPTAETNSGRIDPIGSWES